MISLVQSRQIIKKPVTEPLKQNKSIYERNSIKEDYYSDVDGEYEIQVETIRTIGNWMSLLALAMSIIVSLVLVIVLLHLKSVKESQLTRLM